MKHLVPLLLSIVLAACSSSETSTVGAPDGGDVTEGGGGSDGGGTKDGGTGTSDGSGSNPDQMAAYCEAKKSHDTVCNGNSTSSCDGDSACLYGTLMTTAAAAAYNECYSAPSCKSDDNCVSEAGKASGGAAAAAYPTDCQAKISSCSLSISGELCTPSPYAYRDVGEAFTACLSKPCNEVEACFDAALLPVSNCKN